MKFIAVTSCATGIAHSYMAAEALEKIAKQLDVNYKVEIQGALGIENRIEALDLKDARVIIFANDVGLTDHDRFEDYKDITIQSSPHEVIRHPDKVKKIIEEYLKK
ncbi:fructose PTS transporter subunit IIB [Enterococcus hirae]|nr:fructose PTS transporter subunit IIB [Enterococcus hirae]